MNFLKICHIKNKNEHKMRTVNSNFDALIRNEKKQFKNLKFIYLIYVSNTKNFISS